MLLGIRTEKNRRMTWIAFLEIRMPGQNPICCGLATGLMKKYLAVVEVESV
jgi:hypothetical protein